MQQITKLSINILKVHPQNQEFFDDIDGDQYEKFKKSIQEDGIITPLTVAPDMTIISGHQRYKACKDLGIGLVPVIINEDLINEDDKLKKLLAANFGRLKNDETKQRKVAVKYVELCGLKNGRPKKDSDNRNVLSLEEIAKQLGTSKTTLTELLAIERKLTPETKELLNNGLITKTTASKIWTKLSPIEQSQFIEELGKDKIAEMTQKQTETYIRENKILKQQLQDEQNKEPEIIDNTDYTVINKLKSDLENQKNQYRIAKEKEELLKDRIKLFEEDSQNFKDLKRQIEILSKEKDDIGRAVTSATELSGYIYNVEEFLKTKLAPVTYSRALLDCKDNTVVIKNVLEIIECVEKWCMDTRKYLPIIQQNIINVEVI